MNELADIRRTSGRALFWQYVAVLTVALLVSRTLPPRYSSYVVFGCIVLYILLYHGLKVAIPRAHRRAEALMSQGRYEEAACELEHGLGFFTRFAWLDRYRAVFLLSVSRVGYREAALINMSYCYTKLGDSEKARACYERLGREFPGNPLIRKMAEAVDKPSERQ